MEQIVRVHRLLGPDRAEVIHVRQSACSGDCHKCSGCGAAKETLIVEADNPIGAQPGDQVVVSSDSGSVMRAAAAVYMLPLVLFFAGYAIAAAWGMGALGGGIGFVMGILAAVGMDRSRAKKNHTVYTITGYAGDGIRYDRKGDNDLD